MKKYSTIAAIILLAVTILACGDSNESNMVNSGLDVRALPTIIKQAKEVSEIEAKINEQDGINNVDLDNDGNVDYIYVTEKIEDGETVFTFTTFSTGEAKELASVNLKNENETMNYRVNSSYGHYDGSFSESEFMLWYYILGPRTVYYTSPYYYTRSYPTTYVRYRRVDSRVYTSRVSSQRAPVQRSTSSSKSITSAKSSSTSPSSGSKSTSTSKPSTSRSTTTSRPSSTSSSRSSSRK